MADHDGTALASVASRPLGFHMPSGGWLLEPDWLDRLNWQDSICSTLVLSGRSHKSFRWHGVGAIHEGRWRWGESRPLESLSSTHLSDSSEPTQTLDECVKQMQQKLDKMRTRGPTDALVRVFMESVTTIAHRLSKNRGHASVAEDDLEEARRLLKQQRQQQVRA